MSLCRILSLLALTALLAACASQPVAPYPRPAPESAQPPAAGGPFAAIEAQLQRAHGPAASGFELLDRNDDGLRWRLALIDSATQSIDMQYYVWFGDVAGKLLIKRLLDAADRGVKVRLLVDDLNTLLRDATTLQLRDGVVAAIDAHPNLELRLFNPWTDRSLAGRIGESLADTARVNQRMHNKAMIVDNRVAILGGRNIGDEYMGLSAAFNFHDLDVIGIGPVARQASAVFDLYWNSAWVMPVAALRIDAAPAQAEAVRSRLAQELAESKSLQQFPVAPQSWTAEIEALRGRLHGGTSAVHTDIPADGAIRQETVERIYRMAGEAQRELLIVNAYIIPADRTIATLRGLHGRGVKTTILTNSLASHDVPAVNSHYKKWRKPLLQSGVALYETRHDAAVKPVVADTAPTKSEFMGLHSKGMVIDRQRCYVGSMNFDPRSANINTEMGLFVESPGLCGALAKLIERDIQPANSWQVRLDGAGDLRWVNDRETVTKQPARSYWQRVEDVIFMAFPKEIY